MPGVSISLETIVHDAEIVPSQEYDPDRIRQCETGAEALQWEAAERIYAGVADGKKKQDIAREIGKSPAHITQMSKIGKLYLGKALDSRPPFNEAYQAAKKPKKELPSAEDPKQLPGDEAEDRAAEDGSGQSFDDENQGCAVSDPFVHLSSFLARFLEIWDEERQGAQSKTTRNKVKARCQKILAIIEEEERSERG